MGEMTENPGGKMKKLSVVLVFALAWAAKSPAQQKVPLRLAQTVSVPGVERKWDHFGVDLKGHRLFVTSEESPAVEVFDLETNKHITALTEFKEPHNVLALPELKQLLVVDGEASEIKALDYSSYKLIGHTELSIDADPIAYDPATKYLYVVNGGREAHTPYCLISVVDTKSGRKLADMKLDTNRLESMALEKSGPRLFVNMTGANEIGVVDREKRTVVETWPITAGKENVPMQFDEAAHRLFVATRKPSKLVVVNTDTGKEVTSLPVADYVDDLAYDSAHHRLYVPGGGAEGAISVVEQRGADDYQVIANIPTKPGAKTARFVPELNKYYVGVPAKDKQEAEILVFDVVP
jgi:DNA-binding beta-propeller fold protein YncE